ncbi:MAG TPA: hypothetical protein VIK21_10815 [Desulfuromonadaceae bacterium]|jgi:hypothetical protein
MDVVPLSTAQENSFSAASLGLSDGEAIQLDLEALVLSPEIGMQRNR